MVLYIVFSPHVPLNLANNIDMAIKACAPERSNQLRNRDAMQIVEESLDDGYCDITGRIGDSDLDLKSLIQHKHDVLARFSRVLKLLAEVYKIPPTSLHIFADKDGKLIAFNRNGSLFVNLRYFETWRTSCVPALP